jgi:hypothetical protein
MMKGSRSGALPDGEIVIAERACFESGSIQSTAVDGIFHRSFSLIKYAQRAENGCSLDFGAGAQCYCNQRFLEMETLGPYGVLRPGESVGHREVWRMVEAPFPSLDEGNLSAFMNSDQMAAICQGMI